MKFEIKHRGSDEVLFTAETKSLKLAVELAVKGGANLHDANLGGADLHGANLGGANLHDANLHGAYLHDANLHGAYLRGAYLRGAYLGDANLRGANLRDANLRDANLGGANLHDANLHDANLHGANLGGANLRGANLRGAKGINKFLTTPLYLLQDQIGKIRGYKLTKADGTGPYYSSITYEVGKTYTVENANCDESEQCAEGISLATLDWCIKEWKQGYRIFVAEFANRDIACIPLGSDGKFRVHKCKIVAEKDLKEIGLAE